MLSEFVSFFIEFIFLLLLGIYKISQYDEMLRKLHEKYGPVVRQDIGTRTVIHAFDPDDVQIVLNADGKTPIVPPLQETTKIYREKRELSPGLGNTYVVTIKMGKRRSHAPNKTKFPNTCI